MPGSQPAGRTKARPAIGLPTSATGTALTCAIRPATRSACSSSPRRIAARIAFGALAHAARRLDLGFRDRAGLGDILGARSRHAVDAAHEAGVLVEQVVEVVDREREDARGFDGD